MFKTYLVTAIGRSGTRYCLSFECEDEIDAARMAADCGVIVEGVKVSEQLWEDMPEQRVSLN